MFNKFFLVNRLVKSLVKKEFQYFLCKGCFDIAAKKKFLMLIKALTNVDSLIEEQAKSLRTISYFLSAYPLIVSERTNRGCLSDEIIYSRFEVPVVTPRTFDCMIEEETIPEIRAKRGKHVVRINTTFLKRKRKELNLSLEQLSEEIGISKKALYEIENERVNPTRETVEKLEKFFGVNLKIPYRFTYTEATYLQPRDEFQERVSFEFSRIGIENSAVYSAPFQIIGKEENTLITSLSKNSKRIRKEAKLVKTLSSLFSSQGIFVAKKCKESSFDGIPVLLESELSELENSKELSRLIQEKGG